MKNSPNQTWVPIALIAGALAVWGGFLALGAYLAPVGKEAGQDSRKLLVVAATTGGFLLFWGAMLAIREVKLRRRKTKQQQAVEHPDGEPPT